MDLELDADYWCRNLREVVQFGRAVKSLLDDRHGVFVELRRPSRPRGRAEQHERRSGRHWLVAA